MLLCVLYLYIIENCIQRRLNRDVIYINLAPTTVTAVHFSFLWVYYYIVLLYFSLEITKTWRLYEKYVVVTHLRYVAIAVVSFRATFVRVRMFQCLSKQTENKTITTTRPA